MLELKAEPTWMHAVQAPDLVCLAALIHQCSAAAASNTPGPAHRHCSPARSNPHPFQGTPPRCFPPSGVAQHSTAYRRHKNRTAHPSPAIKPPPPIAPCCAHLHHPAAIRILHRGVEMHGDARVAAGPVSHGLTGTHGWTTHQQVHTAGILCKVHCLLRCAITTTHHRHLSLLEQGAGAVADGTGADALGPKLRGRKVDQAGQGVCKLGVRVRACVHQGRCVCVCDDWAWLAECGCAHHSLTRAWQQGLVLLTMTPANKPISASTTTRIWPTPHP